jgi:hypothetical protein
MRKLIVVSALSILLGTSDAYADAVSADSIIRLQLTDVAGNALPRFEGGGPFRADLEGTQNDFLTFCLEVNEYFTPNENLKIKSISDEAKAGGMAGSTGSGDPISGTTAYMYTQFRLGDSDFSNAVLLQEAIWYEENEKTSASAAAKDLIKRAQEEMLALNWDSNFLGGVQVLNLYRNGVGDTNYSVKAQDMLTWDGATRVPEPGTLLLFGLASCFLAGERLQRRARPATKRS